MAVDATGNVFVVDNGNSRIREITPAGFVSTLAGSGEAGFADGAGTAAEFYEPRFVAIDVAGSLYVADGANYRIRKLTRVP